MTTPENLHRRLDDFHLGAPVHTSDGRHIGSLHRVVVDQESWDPHLVIVKESVRFNGHYLALYAGLMTDELIVPVSSIAQMSHDRVDLSLTSKDARRLPPYLSYSWAPLTPKDAVADDISIVVGAPRMPREIEAAAKAASDIEIRSDENVMLGHEGHKLGHVRDVLFDEGELVGVVVHPVGFLQQDVVVQVRFLERSDDGALFVHLTQEDLKHLQPFQPKPE